MTSNNTLERAVVHRGRPVLAMDWVLGRAQWRARGRPLNSVVRQQLKAPERIRTTRLSLRQPMDADVSAIFEYASDPEVTHHLVWRRVTDSAQVREYLTKCQASWANGSEHTWFVAELVNDRVIGAVAARMRGAEAEIGFVLNRGVWNLGYMTEAAAAIVNWLLSIPSIERISATCDAENLRSVRVLEKLGLTRQGTVPAGMIRPNISDKPRESYVYAKQRTAV